MALLNYRKREINAKIVYYGPGLSGKTTNVHFIHQKLKPAYRGKLMSLATESDRTLFFDFLPVELGEINGLHTRFQIYTVPGQVFYNATRKLVLKNVDGVVFVADSQRKMMGANLESFKNLEENLRMLGKSPKNIPIVVQYNKRDMEDVLSVEELEDKVNVIKAPHKLACANKGEGVLETLTLVSKMVLNHLKKSPEFARTAQGLAADGSGTAPIAVGAESGVAAVHSPAPSPPSPAPRPAAKGSRFQSEDLESTTQPIADSAIAAQPELPAPKPDNGSVKEDFDRIEELETLADELEEAEELESLEEMEKQMGGKTQTVLSIVECKPAERINDKTFRIPMILTDTLGQREYLFQLTLSTDLFGGSDD